MIAKCWIYRGLLLASLWMTTAYADVQNYLDKQQQILSDQVTLKQLERWKDDLLFPHLYQQWLYKNIEHVSVSQIEQFFEESQNQAASVFLKYAWWEENYRRENWSYLAKSLANHNNPQYQCRAFQAKQHLNQTIPSQDLKTLWLSGLTLPSECDDLMAYWLKQQDNPDALIWQRHIKSFYLRDTQVVETLTQQYQSQAYQTAGALLARVYNQPASFIEEPFQPNKPLMAEIAMAAVNRLAYQNPTSSSNLWLQVLKATSSLNASQIQQTSKHLGIAMAKLNWPEGDYWLNIADPYYQDEEVQHWRLQIALYQQNFERILNLFNQLSPTLAASNQWQYWKGLAQLKTDKKLSSSNPLHTLSQERHYYGFLAARALNKPPQLNEQTPPALTKTQQTIQNHIALKRAKALFDLGEHDRAQQEWRYFFKALPKEQQLAASIAAFNLELFAQSAQAAWSSGHRNALQLRFPTPFKHSVSQHSKTLKIPKHWIYAVMRQESAFQITAISHAGARGLMQIMPKTAQQTVRKHQLNFKPTPNLYNPTTNISIGSHYLYELGQTFKNPIYASAAYNAGPSRVKSWLERFPNDDLTIWIESIPFDETRNYVKAIIAYSQIYAIQLNIPWELDHWLS